MLASARKLSQKDSFTVFDDSQLEEPCAAAGETRDIEIQTDLAFEDANEATEISIPVEEEETDEDDPTTQFWKKAAAVKKTQLEQLRKKNEEKRAQIAENKAKKAEIDAQYAVLFEKLSSVLEDSAQK